MCGVSAEYRQKLVNWLTSMLVLHTICAALFAMDWFNRLSLILPYNEGSAWLILEAIIWNVPSFVFFFGALLIWHLADFAQPDRVMRRWFEFLGNYHLLVVVLCLVGLSALFNQSGWLNDIGCPEENFPPNAFVFDGCGSWTPFWKEAILMALTFAFVLLVLGKLILAIAYRATGLRKWALSKMG